MAAAICNVGSDLFGPIEYHPRSGGGFDVVCGGYTIGRCGAGFLSALQDSGGGATPEVALPALRDAGGDVLRMTEPAETAVANTKERCMKTVYEYVVFVASDEEESVLANGQVIAAGPAQARDQAVAEFAQSSLAQGDDGYAVEDVTILVRPFVGR